MAGWSWGPAWINTSTLLERLNAANTFLQLAGRTGNGRLLVERFGGDSPSAIVRQLLDALVDGDVPDHVRAAIEAEAARGVSGRLEGFASDTRQVVRVIRGAVRLIMALPVYQLS